MDSEEGIGMMDAYPDELLTVLSLKLLLKEKKIDNINNISKTIFFKFFKPILPL